MILGTRPEAIKMLPLYHALKKERIPVALCSTGQHKELLEQVFSLFQVTPDYNFDIMRENQDLFYVNEIILNKTKSLLNEIKPSMVIVQGDTTSAMAAALSAFYLKIPIAHVEAGLRSSNIHAPFPEELNRRIITLVATYHFAPTAYAVNQLLSEGIDQESIFLSGNTIVDALYSIQDQITQKTQSPSSPLIEMIEKQKAQGKKILLLTCHRRESFDRGLFQIFSGVKKALQSNPNLFVIFPMHPNPVIKSIVKQTKLETVPNIWITDPFVYTDFVYLLDKVDAVFTDSGGIHEEAVSLGKPLFILRNESDRSEAIQAGLATMIGTEEKRILSTIQNLHFEDISTEQKKSSLYGNGHASEHIAKRIKGILEK